MIGLKYLFNNYLGIYEKFYVHVKVMINTILLRTFQYLYPSTGLRSILWETKDINSIFILGMAAEDASAGQLIFERYLKTLCGPQTVSPTAQMECTNYCRKNRTVNA